MTEIYLKMSASMEHRVAIGSFWFFDTKNAPKYQKKNFWQPRWNMISPVIFAGPWRFLLGPCPRGPHAGDGAEYVTRILEISSSFTKWENFADRLKMDKVKAQKKHFYTMGKYISDDVFVCVHDVM